MLMLEELTTSNQRLTKRLSVFHIVVASGIHINYYKTSIDSTIHPSVHPFIEIHKKCHQNQNVGQFRNSVFHLTTYEDLFKSEI